MLGPRRRPRPLVADAANATAEGAAADQLVRDLRAREQEDEEEARRRGEEAKGWRQTMRRLSRAAAGAAGPRAKLAARAARVKARHAAASSL